MSERQKYRMERIERLLKELQYEVTRGMMDGDIEDEAIGFCFYVPVSKVLRDGVVRCEFRTEPVDRILAMCDSEATLPRLKIIK